MIYCSEINACQHLAEVDDLIHEAFFYVSEKESPDGPSTTRYRKK